jgi:hypothetical protein
MTIFQTLRRGLRRAAAAGLAAAVLAAVPAASQPEPGDGMRELAPLERADRPREDGFFEPFFHKVGTQLSCDHVRYRIRFGFNASPAALDSPLVAEFFDVHRFALTDQLPAGLSIENAVVAGDVTGVGGGAMPAHVISSTGGPDDTVDLGDFQMSLVDLDGFGAPGERSMSMTILARIDPAAFPAPAIVPNQAFLEITRVDGPSATAASHDPALPDDGSLITGEPTNVAIDLTGCDRPPPPPPPPGDDPETACFRVDTGEVDCTPGGAAFIYHMDFGPEMGGNVVQLRSNTPGIAIDPPAQVVPAGGGTLSWTIHGAAPGDVVELVVVGVETYAGPAEGVGICCTQIVELVIPEDLDCPDRVPEPDIRVEKRADVSSCTREGGCDFTITVTNAGDGTYDGRIVLEEVTTPGSAAVSSGPNAPWTCVPGVSPMLCEHPPTTLEPGESVELKLGFTPGPGWEARYIRNCAEYDYTASGKEAFGDLSNDKACAVIPLCVPGQGPECTPQDEPRVDLTIRKRAAPAECTPDGLCRFVIEVINSGTAVHNGPLVVVDEFSVHPPVSVNFAPTPPWSCVAESGIRFRCEHPAIALPPGGSVPLTVHAVVTDYPTDMVENCAELEPVPAETDLGNNRSCATARIPGNEPGRPLITIDKTGDAECTLGGECRFQITITNGGDAAFSGPMNLGDAIEIEGLGGTAVPIVSVNPPFGCATEPTELPFMCEATIELGAGESRSHEVVVRLPDAGAFPDGPPNGPLDGRNCAAIVEPGAVVERDRALTRAPVAGEEAEGRHSCHPFRVGVPQEEEPQCSPGFVMNEAGRCVCPQGTSFRNGQCVGEQGTIPVPTPRPTPPPAQQCTLLPGQVRTQSGECVCPRGTRLRNGRCVERTVDPQPQQPPARQCTLLPGQIRTQSGECVCPRGTRLSRGRCVEVTTVPQCGQGEVLRNGRCVTVQREPACNPPAIMRNGRCVIVERLPQRQPSIIINPQILEPLFRGNRGSDQGGVQRQKVPGQ